MNTRILITLLISIAIGVVNTAVAQQQNPTPKHLMREDSAAVNALVMYPDTIRLHIFEACEYPAAIVSIASLQKNSSSDFAELISGYSKSEQEDFWDLSRYPTLISQLVQGGRKSTDEINVILTEYPANIHETALKYGREYYDELQKIDELQSRTDAQFEQIIADYPPETQVALRDIIQYPEIISLLNDHLSLTVRVGDRFRRDPERVIRKADSLNLAETRQNAENAEAWKETLDQNPDDEADLQDAANQYATENGYTEEDVNIAPGPDEVTNYTCTPYSFWFGYPAWYPYSYWYPYPYWFDCGFYHDRSGRIVIISTPSHYFTNWYFYRPEHWKRFPHLCNAYIDHYYAPRRTVGENTVIVHNWVRENKNYLPKDFVANRSIRTEAVRQLGQLNIDAQKVKGGKPVTPSVRDQYFQNNKSRYPSLRADINPGRAKEVKLPVAPAVIQPPVRQPPVRISEIVRPTNPRQTSASPDVRNAPPSQKPAENPRLTPAPPAVRNTPPVEKPAENPRLTPAPPAVRNAPPAEKPAENPRQTSAPPAYNFSRIEKAQEYHKNVWEQTQPTVRPQPQPAPRPTVQQPVRQEPPTRTAPGKKR